MRNHHVDNESADSSVRSFAPPTEISSDAETGERYVCFFYTLSFIIVTFKRPSKIYCLQPGEYAIKRGWPYILISVLFGWWGVPWGPLYTLESIIYGFIGRDLSKEEQLSWTGWKGLLVLLLGVPCGLGFLFGCGWFFFEFLWPFIEEFLVGWI